MSENRFPPGWNEDRVHEIIAHYEDETEDEQFAEIEAAYEAEGVTMMAVPTELESEVRADRAKTISLSGLVRARGSTVRGKMSCSPCGVLRNEMASVRKSWRSIEDVLYENAHSVYRALRNPATDAGIHKLQRLVRAKLSADFIQSLKVHDGLRLSYLGANRLFDYQALLPISAISREYKMMCDLQEECDFAGFETSTRKIKNDAHWRVGWAPFTDADCDKFVLDLDPGPDGRFGQVIQFENVGGEPRRVLAHSYGEWLSIVASTFEKREFRLDERGSIWIQDLHLFY